LTYFRHRPLFGNGTKTHRGIKDAEEPLVLQPFHEDTSGKELRYYQADAINHTIEAVAAGQNRVLLVMATGTGKTYVAFQIIWRLWKAGRTKRTLFLADRNILIDQALINDFKPFAGAMTKVTGHKFDPAYEVHLALYQAITGTDEEDKAFKKLSPDFFDLIACSTRCSPKRWRRVKNMSSRRQNNVQPTGSLEWVSIQLVSRSQVTLCNKGHLSHGIRAIMHIAPATR
jgi:type I site-specific restriction endonuclease